MERIFEYLADDVKFVCRDGKLQALEFDHRIFNLKYMTVKEFWRVGGSEPQEVYFEENFYESEDDFKKGHPISGTKKISIEDIFSSINWRIKDCKAWIYDRGCAKLQDFTEIVDEISFDKTGRFKCVGYDMPKIYKNAEEVYNENDYVFIDENGQKHVRKAKYSVYYITAEQMAVFEELKAAIKKVEDAGMHIVFDRDSDELCVFDSERVVEFGYYDEVPEPKEEEGEIEIEMCFPESQKVVIYGINVEYHAIVKNS